MALERKHAVEVPGLNFTLVGKPDRLDLLEDGRLRIVDYKTGAPRRASSRSILRGSCIWRR